MNTANPVPSYEGFSDLHHAGEARIRSVFVAGGYDRGELTLEPGRVRFRGMRSEVDCVGVTSIGLARKTFPWPIVLGVAVLFLGIAWLKSPSHVSIRAPLPYLVLGILAVGSFLQLRERWVEVTWQQDGKVRRDYFRRDPVFGFGSSRRRTQDLLRSMHGKVLGTTPAG